MHLALCGRDGPVVHMRIVVRPLHQSDSPLLIDGAVHGDDVHQLLRIDQAQSRQHHSAQQCAHPPDEECVKWGE